MKTHQKNAIQKLRARRASDPYYYGSVKLYYLTFKHRRARKKPCKHQQ